MSTGPRNGVYRRCCGGGLTPLRSRDAWSLPSSLGVFNEDARNGADDARGGASAAWRRRPSGTVMSARKKYIDLSFFIYIYLFSLFFFP